MTGRPEAGPERLLTKAETAAALSVSPRMVDKLRASGDLESVKVGTAVRVSTSSIASFIAAHRQTAPGGE